MVRVLRNRVSNDPGEVLGNYVKVYKPDPSKASPWNQSYSTSMSFDAKQRDTWDWHGGPLPWPDSSFNKKETRVPPLTFSGTFDNATWHVTNTRTPCVSAGRLSAYAAPWDVGAWALPTYDDATLGLMALASMNPNVPRVDIPVFIGELKDLPHLLKDAGNIALGKLDPEKLGPTANLAAQFGILPLVSDLYRLLDFTDEVDRREKYLRELSAGNARIKRTLRRSVATGTFNTAWKTSGQSYSGDRYLTLSGTARQKVWFTARATLVDPLPERDLRSAAFRTALGFYSPNWAQAWELLPWSWLIDYFTTIGLFLNANRRGLKWKYKDLNVMVQNTYTISEDVEMGSLDWLHPVQDASRMSATTKYRTQPSVFYPSFRRPWLGLSQWAILGSLVTLRGR